MPNDNPMNDKPFFTKMPGNMLKINQNHYKAWLPMFYCLPREIVELRSEYLKLPRCPYEVVRTDKYDKLVCSDAFIELIWDAYAGSVWQFLPVPSRDGTYSFMKANWNNYSGYFPPWSLSYMITCHIKQKLESENIFSFYKLFSFMPGMELAWATLESFSTLIRQLTLHIIQEENYQPTIDTAWLNRTEEDFDETRVSRERIDAFRKWHHSRSDVGIPLSMEQMKEDSESEDSVDIADARAEFEESLLSEMKIKEFVAKLPERDRRILELKLQGMTDQEIAGEVGYQNHSAVVKRRQFIGKKLRQFADDETLNNMKKAT